MIAERRTAQLNACHRQSPPPACVPGPLATNPGPNVHCVPMIAHRMRHVM
jgi:hypothetical protein